MGDGGPTMEHNGNALLRHIGSKSPKAMASRLWRNEEWDMTNPRGDGCLCFVCKAAGMGTQRLVKHKSDSTARVIGDDRLKERDGSRGETMSA